MLSHEAPTKAEERDAKIVKLPKHCIWVQLQSPQIMSREPVLLGVKTVNCPFSHFSTHKRTFQYNSHTHLQVSLLVSVSTVPMWWVIHWGPISCHCRCPAVAPTQTHHTNAQHCAETSKGTTGIAGGALFVSTALRGLRLKLWTHFQDYDTKIPLSWLRFGCALRHVHPLLTLPGILNRSFWLISDDWHGWEKFGVCCCVHPKQSRPKQKNKTQCSRYLSVRSPFSNRIAGKKKKERKRERKNREKEGKWRKGGLRIFSGSVVTGGWLCGIKWMGWNRVEGLKLEEGWNMGAKVGQQALRAQVYVRRRGRSTEGELDKLAHSVSLSPAPLIETNLGIFRWYCWCQETECVGKLCLYLHQTLTVTQAWGPHMCRAILAWASMPPKNLIGISSLETPFPLFWLRVIVTCSWSTILLDVNMWIILLWQWCQLVYFSQERNTAQWHCSTHTVQLKCDNTLPLSDK